MKYVVTAEGPSTDDRVDPRFGRARYLILHDTDTGVSAVVDNAAQVAAAQGAGVQAAQKVVELGADALITGRCGPKAFDVLSAAGVPVYSGQAGGTVLEAVAACERGDVAPLASPDGRSHA